MEYVTEILTWEPTDRLVVDIRGGGGSLGPNAMRVTRFNGTTLGGQNRRLGRGRAPRRDRTSSTRTPRMEQ